MPGFGEAATRAVIGNLELLQALNLHECDFFIEAFTAFEEIRHRLGIAEIHLVDDGQHRNLKKNSVQPRAFDGDINLTRRQGRDRDVFVVELEQAQKIHKIAFDKAQRTQIGQLCVLKAQLAQRAYFLAYLIHIRRKLHARVAAFKAVLHLRTGKLVQHDLHHGEFVQVGIEQAGDDHGQRWAETVRSVMGQGRLINTHSANLKRL